jgi:hypothetical protein
VNAKLWPDKAGDIRPGAFFKVRDDWQDATYECVSVRPVLEDVWVTVPGGREILVLGSEEIRIVTSAQPQPPG